RADRPRRAARRAHRAGGGRPPHRRCDGLLGPAGRTEPVGLANLGLEIGEDGRILLEPFLRVLPALPDALVLERVPGAGLLDELLLDAGVEDRPRLGDALAIDGVERGFARRRREVVIDDLPLRA